MTSANKTAYRYRADIDSLRCIAVLGVILFHLDAEYLAGGFTGVDIFFVISGYLITGVVYSEIGNSSFSFTEFYRRRIKRIIPPMLLMIFITLIAGQFILLPDDFSELSQVSVYALFSLVNIYYAYFFDASYFSPGAEYQPFLHLWSLGIEEQFYFLWPALLFIFCRVSRPMVSMSFLLLVMLLSFVYAESQLDSNLELSYYLLPSRAGELLAGSSLVFISRHSSVIKFLSHQIVSTIFLLSGLILVIYSYIFISENDGFPGFRAIPPVLGAGFIILSGISVYTFLHRIMSMRLVVYIGLISYPLYLWHWPILAYARYMYGDLSLLLQISCVLLTLMFSIFSYHILEKWCRKSKSSFSRILSVQFFFPAAAILLISIAVIKSSGFGIDKFSSYEEQYGLYEDGLMPSGRQSYMCKSLKTSNRYFRNENCTINSATKTSAVLWGDSHAQHYVGLIGEIGREYGYSFSVATHQACLPLLHDSIVFAGKKHQLACKQSLNDMVNDVDDIEVVMLAGAWSTHLKNHGSEFNRGVEHTVELLKSKNKKVVLLGEVPRIKNYDRLCNLKSLKLSHLDCGDRMVGSRQASDSVNAILKQVANSHTDVMYFEPHHLLCDENECDAYLDDDLLYFDSGHLSFNGSVKLGERIAALKNEPEFVSLFSSKEDEISDVLPWDPLLKDKIQYLDYAKNEFPVSWSGPIEKTQEGNVIYDKSTNEITYGYVSLGPSIGTSDMGRECIDGIFHARYLFEKEYIQNVSLLSLRINNNVSQNRAAYNIWISHSNGAYLSQGLANQNNSYVKIDGQYVDVYFKMRKLRVDESAQLLVYPSVGEELVRMNKANTGSLKNITLNYYCKNL